jgi:hypothetical protein
MKMPARTPSPVAEIGEKFRAAMCERDIDTRDEIIADGALHGM